MQGHNDPRKEWLKSKMDDLFEMKNILKQRGKDINMSIQAGREYRNPRIGEKLIEMHGIKQHGTNLPKEHHDPDRWNQKPDAFYDSVRYELLRKEREAQKSALRHKSRD